MEDRREDKEADVDWRVELGGRDQRNKQNREGSREHE